MMNEDMSGLMVRGSRFVGLNPERFIFAQAKQTGRSSARGHGKFERGHRWSRWKKVGVPHFFTHTERAHQ